MALQGRTARRLLGCGLLILVVGGILVSFRTHEIWQWLLDHEQRAHELVNERPVRGFFLGLIAFSLISLIPGLLGKSLAVAWLFGFWRSLAIVNISLTVVAVIEYYVTRLLFRDSIHSRYGFHLIKLNEALERDGAFYVFSMRVAHVPYTATNYLMGATSLRPLPFLISTQLGLLPSNIVFCYAGAHLPSLAEVSKHGIGQIMSVELWVGFALLAVLPWVGKFVVRKLRKVEA